ncbi:uncharacterized mitochondrial protein AtMg00810-like [Rutidosis leptorrhynchoides]|uniref:uncharacterized mitochondrial protein AtMg00810-like n=1 Tax=Rutidosis leptorrhynchoides TaxID=125765 RepID=UPI003A990736
MSKLGLLYYFLGLQVEQKDHGIFLHQAKYVNDILERFCMTQERPVSTPLAVNHGISIDCEGEPVDLTYYRAIIGSLLYLTASRPDIRLQNQPTNQHQEFLGERLVTWQCKKQTSVALSTCEAEYIAAASCCSQVIWIQ